MSYHHLNQEQRFVIAALLKTGSPKSLSAIARELGVHRSTISRELKRNSDGRGKHKYNPLLAQRKSDKRNKERPHWKKFIEEMMQTARQLLLEKEYSPEQISGRCHINGIQMVSYETLYQWIWAEKRKGNKELAEHLRHKGRKYEKRGNSYQSRGIIKERVGIEKRPQIVDEKKRFGDFEIDTIIGRNHKGAIMTIHDRYTRMVWIRKLEGKDAISLSNAAIESLSPYKSISHTLTADNGKEFEEHSKIANELGIQFYFARPYHSWERGANENTNGLIRQYLPKGTDFSMLTKEHIAEIEGKLNNRPRKTLGYLTPFEFFLKNYTFAHNSVALST